MSYHLKKTEVNLKANHFALNLKQTVANKTKMTPTLPLQRKVPYGFPSGLGLTYVTLKKTYFYFPLSERRKKSAAIKGDVYFSSTT